MIQPNPVAILVEDDVSVLRALRRLLVSASYDVLQFDHPHAVLEAKLPDSNACLIVDIHLPEMNGAELCEALAATGCRLPVIVITAHSDAITLSLTTRISTVAVLFKPFGRKALLEALNRALISAKSA
jgi:two-component system, LuxR family, response regulator FixJ